MIELANQSIESHQVLRCFCRPGKLPVETRYQPRFDRFQGPDSQSKQKQNKCDQIAIANFW